MATPQFLRSKTISYFRNFLFLFYFQALLFPLCALYLANTTGNYNHYGWWLALAVIVFGAVDQLIGREPVYPLGDQLEHQEKSIYYSFIIFLSLPAAMVLSVYGAYFVSNEDALNWAGRIGWILSLGMGMTALTLSAGHELIHREKPIERLCGSFLFALVCNAVFCVEHIRGHHVNAATPLDAAYANFNQSFYHYFPRTLKNAYINAWRVEKKRLNRKGHLVLSWRNEMISWHLVTLVIAIIYYFFFGLFGLIFFIGQGFVALTIHCIVNYIQHYGLKRRKLDDGRYEKFSTAHAWNCNFFMSNMAFLHFPNHTDHHLNPRCPYQHLRHCEKSPQMPMGYIGMVFMTMIPPLWFKVMNPLVLENRTRNLEAGNFGKKASASIQLDASKQW